MKPQAKKFGLEMWLFAQVEALQVLTLPPSADPANGYK